jgi:hypothetical protein
VHAPTTSNRPRCRESGGSRQRRGHTVRTVRDPRWATQPQHWVSHIHFGPTTPPGNFSLLWTGAHVRDVRVAVTDVGEDSPPEPPNGYR